MLAATVPAQSVKLFDAFYRAGSTLDAVAKLFAAAPDAFEHFLLATGTEALLRGGVHFAECAPVPGTAVSHRQDQQIRLARRAVDGFDIADGDDGHA